MKPFIQLENVCYRYEDHTLALHQISMAVYPGQRVGIVGANGAGKSTLLHHMNGIFIPQQGRVVVDGMESKSANLAAIRRRVGMVFQHSDDQLFMPRVLDDVLFGPLNLKVPPDQAMQTCREVMSYLDIWALREKHPFRLSAGQKRFVAMATVLVMKPAVTVLDEPTSDLDPKNRRRLIQTVNRLPGTWIMASHDLDFIWDTCEQTLVLSQGQIAASGPTRDILSSRSIMEENQLEPPLRLLALQADHK